jgi:hydroxymethylglutaryl-CoA synthase
MNVGIDRIGFYTSRYFLPLKALADHRKTDYEKYHTGLGQEQMAIAPPDEDVVTLAANAAQPVLQGIDSVEVELLLFATETGVDQSKAAGLFVHRLLELSPACRVVELKEACYAGTAGLQMAAACVASGMVRKALVLTADIARYELGSPGEPTQGCGAAAMLVSANPAVLALDPAAGVHAEDVMDFWRPNYRTEALVDGKYSTRMYLSAAEQSWKRYTERTGRPFDALIRCCYHLPFTNMGRKAHERLLKVSGHATVPSHLVELGVGEGLAYNRKTGNSYTASLYESLCCLLDTASDNLEEARLGLFSYGSGCVGEFFSGVIQPGYRQHLLTEHHRRVLDDRTELTYQQYEDMYNLKVPEDGWDYAFAQYRTGPFRFGGIEGHKRRYGRTA